MDENFEPAGGVETDGVVEPEVETPDLDAEGMGDSSTSEEDAGEEPKKVPWFQKRIDEVTRQKYEAQREADRLKWELEQVKPKEKEEAAPETKDPWSELGREPQEDDFDDYGDFRKAQREWDRKLAVIEAKAELLAIQAAEREKAQKQTQAQKLESWGAKGNEKFPDFAEVALKHPKDGGPPYTDAMREAVLASDKGHEIAYHLGKNPDEALRLAKLSPVQAAYEVAKLEVKLSSIKPKTISDAPGPIKPLTPTKGGEADLYDPKLPMSEFAKRWRSQRKSGS